MKQAKSCGNVDGCNAKKSQCWLWVAVTPLVTFFEIALSRCADAARNLLGEDFSGILNSDQYAAYNWDGLSMHCVLVRDRPCGQLLIASTSGSATGEDWAAKRSAGCGLQKSRVANTKSW